MHTSTRAPGFTIVELLIVIVVIGILATITIVAYTGIQQRAAESALLSDLRGAGNQLSISQQENGQFPNSDSGLKKSASTNLQYTSDGATFCLTGTSSRANIPAYFISSDNLTVRKGVCPGHTDPTAGAPEINGTVTTLSTTSYINNMTAIAASGTTVYWGVGFYYDVYIEKITPQGASNLAGYSTGYADGQGGPSSTFPARFGDGGTHIAIDSSGNVYVADTKNHSIRKITPTGYVSTLAGTNIAGNANGTGSAARFTNPRGIAIDTLGNLYVADDNRLSKITPTGTVSTVASLSSPVEAVAIDSSGTLYLTVQNRIQKVTQSGTSTTLAGGAGTGFTNGNGTSALFSGPKGLAVSASGNVYVADTGNHSIRKITPSGDVTTLAGTSTSGQTNGTGTAARFNSPCDISITSDNTLYIADCGNSLIRKIN